MSLVFYITIFWLLLVIVGYLFFGYKQLKALQQKINVREEEKKNSVALSYQRERLENIAIQANNNLTGTYLRFGDLNHLLIANTLTDIHVSDNVVDYSFFDSLGLNPSTMSVEDKFVTCLMPFNKQYTKVYDSIKSACLYSGYNCHRSDDKYVPGEILKYTLELILRSQIIIAVLDGRNANVYYEVGIAHSIGKTVILLCNASKFNETPFDVKGSRVVLYQNQEDLQTKLSNVLNNINHA